MSMERLRHALETLGFSDVRSYIQSGNVVFRSPLRLANATLSERIEEMISKEFGFSAGVVARSKQEFEKTVRSNPFLKRGLEAKSLHVIFLPAAPTRGAREELSQLTQAPDEARLLGKEIFLYLPNGVARSSLSNNPIHRKFLGRGTMRNWNTVCVVERMASELA